MDEFLDVRELIESRHNTSAKHLVEPGPSDEQLRELISLAAASPDHGGIRPWRFIVVPREQRDALGEIFAQDLVDRDAAATSLQIEDARQKARRSPLLVVVIARLGPAEKDIPLLERMISVGAAVQNVLLGAHAMGFAAGLTSGRAMSSRRLGDLLQLATQEHAVCCVNIGTGSRATRPKRLRPAPTEFLSVLGHKAGS